MKFFKDRKGFTAVELLFVILFIGLLVLISISFLNTSRTRARDAKRLTDVRRIQTALEFYNLEHSGYPIHEQPIELGTTQYNKICGEASGGIVASNVSCDTTFMSPVPSDPNDHRYLYIGKDDGYTLQFRTEDETALGPAGIYYAHSETIDRSPETN